MLESLTFELPMFESLTFELPMFESLIFESLCWATMRYYAVPSPLPWASRENMESRLLPLRSM